MKTEWSFLKKLKIDPYDPAIPLLGIYPKKMKSLCGRDICTSLVIAALFTITKTWKQPTRLLMDQWIKKMWNTDTVECSSHKQAVLTFVTTWMDLEGILLNELSQREKDK